MNITRDWRAELREYLENPNKRVPHRTKAQAQNFVILERELYRKGFDGLLLKCLSFPNNMEVMRACLEDYTVSWFQRQRTGKIISQLRGTFQGASSTTWKHILVIKPTRRATQEVHQREIPEEVFLYHVGNCKNFPKELRRFYGL